MTAAQIVRALRLRLDLTQEGLAQTLHVTFSTISRWENGHVRPSRLAWLALERLAAEYGHTLGAAVADVDEAVNE